MTDEEIASFWNYAKENMTEEDGTQCQWADYTVRLIENFRRLREENEQMRELLEFVIEPIELCANWPYRREYGLHEAQEGESRRIALLVARDKLRTFLNGEEDDMTKPMTEEEK
jgi:hypothetical protein